MGHRGYASFSDGGLQGRGGAPAPWLLAALCTAAALLALLVIAPRASAETKEIEVPATMQWFLGNGSPFQCYSVGMASWPEQEDAVGWVVHYKWNGDPRERPVSPPFDDETLDRDPYNATPGKGRHWHLLTGGYGSHANPNWPPPDCSEIQSNQKAALSDVKLVITVEPNAKIVGKVKDSSGDGVSGVNVTAKGAGSDSTDADGEYSIDVPETKKTYKVVPKQGKSKFKPESRRVKVKPGETARANFTIKGKPQIVGTVRLDCKGKASCSILPVSGAKITAKPLGGKASAAEAYSAKTDTEGRYEIKVKKGKYEVSAKARMLKTSPKEKRVKVKSKPAEANFTACGANGGASASAVPSGTWESGLQRSVLSDCRNKFTVEYDRDRGDLIVVWQGVPECVRDGKTYASAADAALLVSGLVLPGTYPGQQKQVNDAQVEFSTTGTLNNPISKSASLSGFIHQAGRGEISQAHAVAPGCRFEATGVILKNDALLMK